MMNYEPGDLVQLMHAEGMVTVAILERDPISQLNWNVIVVRSDSPSLPKGFVFKLPEQTLDRMGMHAVPIAIPVRSDADREQQSEWLQNQVIEMGWM